MSKSKTSDLARGLGCRVDLWQARMFDQLVELTPEQIEDFKSVPYNRSRLLQAEYPMPIFPKERDLVEHAPIKAGKTCHGSRPRDSALHVIVDDPQARMP